MKRLHLQKKGLCNDNPFGAVADVAEENKNAENKTTSSIENCSTEKKKKERR